jgi:flagellar hook protein FlgE
MTNLERAMSIQGTFNTAVQAMQAQTQFLNNISTNIANTNTVGYKLQDTHFATLLNHTRPSDKRFFTVNTYDYRQMDKQGAIATTNRTFDLAINGRGYFVTNRTTDSSATFQYTRDGALFGEAVTMDTDTDGNGANDQGTRLITADGSYVYGWPADENGVVTQTNSLSALRPVTFSNESIFAAKPTTLITLQANVAASDSGRQTVGLPFVDQAGDARTVTLGFTAQMGNTWALDVASTDLNGVDLPVTFDPATVSFDGNGKFVDPQDGLLSVEISDALGPQSFLIDLRKVTQLADNNKLTVQNIDQDGYIEGRLDRTYFNGFGELIGSYSNGEVRTLFKLPIATFAAEGNLEAKSGNVFVETHESGELNLKGLGDPTGTTAIVTGALEQSNVDLADQFSKMIITQRAYSSAAKVLTTADEMTMAARDLKR